VPAPAAMVFTSEQRSLLTIVAWHLLMQLTTLSSAAFCR
jgi:hypothetical protein